MARVTRGIAVSCIGLYQATFSPDHGPLKHLHPYGFCRHHPTCSIYAKEVIEKRGIVVGIVLTMKRLLSCNPWAKPDPKRMEQAMQYIIN